MTRDSHRWVVVRAALGAALVLGLTHCGSGQSSDGAPSGGAVGAGTGGEAAQGGKSVGGSAGAGGSSGGAGSSGVGGSTGGTGAAGGAGGTAGGGTSGGPGGAGGVDCNCGRGAYVPVCGADGRTYDAACGLSCVTQSIECMHACPCGDAAGAGGSGGSGGASAGHAGSSGAAGNDGTFVCGDQTCSADEYCRAPCSGTFGGAGSSNPPPSPSCAPMPAACNGTPSCDCICGSFQTVYCNTGPDALPRAAAVQCGCA